MWKVETHESSIRASGFITSGTVHGSRAFYVILEHFIVVALLILLSSPSLRAMFKQSEIPFESLSSGNLQSLESNYVAFICVHVSWKFHIFPSSSSRVVFPFPTHHLGPVVRDTTMRGEVLNYPPRKADNFNINKYYLEAIYENTLFRSSNGQQRIVKASKSLRLWDNCARLSRPDSNPTASRERKLFIHEMPKSVVEMAF